MLTRAQPASPRFAEVAPTWSFRRTSSWLTLAPLLVVMAAVGLWSLLRTPAPFIDEVWFANRAWAFLQTGRNFGTLDQGVWDHFDGYWTYFPWLPSVFVAFAFQI